ncbi:MAG: ferredoxin:thioredoxin reductase [Spirochaetae bacterium HGW-Spirochaetae-9]|nr:MAG: ferredoxin:thioredoxin reductase [Spirochaetae bacterium HGW-Spirochaetae-9]
MTEKTAEQTRLFSRMVAQKQGWELNPDESFYETLIDGLTANYNRYGYYLCPCRDSEGSRETDKDAICPCVWSKLDVPEFGNCFCALYISKQKLASGEAPGSIPDRRYES